MSQDKFISLPGSERFKPRELLSRARLPNDAPVVATVMLRRRAELPESLVQGSQILTRTELAERYGADSDDLELVVSTLGRFGLTVSETDTYSRRIRVEGEAQKMRQAFGATLFQHTAEGVDQESGPSYRCREGGLWIPAELDGVVTAVLGLDDRPQAGRLLAASARARPNYYTPVELARIYNFPPQASGAGERLAIIELGGGYSDADMRQYFSRLGLAAPHVRAVSVDGAFNDPSEPPSSADGEVVLDIEVAGAMASGAEVVVYFAPNNDRGFFDAVHRAVHDCPTPTALSISWGRPEEDWTRQAMSAMNEAFADAAALGVTVTAAVGDEGSSDGGWFWERKADFPASSPYVLACGGTTLDADPETGRVSSETVWNRGFLGPATGGGVSKLFPRPQWQANVPVPGGGKNRGVPDVSALADTVAGYLVFEDGAYYSYGGTSAVAPLWAALVCRLAEALGRPLGLLQPLIYPEEAGQSSYPGFRDITEGTNGAYRASRGWDPCTGLGVPDGRALLEHLEQKLRNSV